MDIEKELEDVPDIDASPVSDGKVPLGICKQMVMKLDSFMTDAGDAMEDPDLDDNQKYIFRMLLEQAGQMGAAILNIIKDEMDEEDFLSEYIGMDEIDHYPGDGQHEPVDLLNALL